MKRTSLAVLLLAVLLALTACGGEEKPRAEGVVYAPERVDFQTGLSTIESGCVSGEFVYLAGIVRGERDGQYTEDYRLYRVPLSGGRGEELSAYRPGLLPEGVSGEMSGIFLRPGADGSIWITESVYAQVFDLPEDFDEESGEKLQYLTSSGAAQNLVQLDAGGNEIFRFDGTELPGNLGAERIYDTWMDGDGNILVNTGGGVAVLDSAGTVRYTLEEGDMPLERFVPLGDGRTGVRFRFEKDAAGALSGSLRTIDHAARDWGERYPLSTSSKAFPGDGDALFYCLDGDALYAWREGAEEGSRILSWIEANINANDLAFFSFLDSGRLAAMTYGEQHSASGSRLSLLTETDASALPVKTVLTLGTVDIFPELRAAVIDFNENSEDYYISVTDYYDQSGSYASGVTRLLTEIMAGKGPDLFATMNLPVARMGGAGVLEDLWPYIDSDPEIDREDLMDRVLRAMERGGKLYQVTNTFWITTVVGARSVVGDRMSWTPADFQAALATMPEGASALGYLGTKDIMLQQCLEIDGETFLDWETGTCSFDSDRFKSLLEFCNTFQAEESDMAFTEEQIYTGQQMLSAGYIQGYESFKKDKFLFGGEISFVGYPNTDGAVGSCFSPNLRSSVALSSSCKDKDGAWSFLRTFLLPKGLNRGKLEDQGSYFPINRSDFEEVTEWAMTPIIQKDTEGNDVEIPRHSYSFNGYPEIAWDITATTQEEYDQFMTLYNAIDRVAEEDGQLVSIVTEAAGAYFAGDKSLDDTAREVQSRVSLYVNEQK